MASPRLASVADPHPTAAALLASTEALPDYADDSLLDHGPARSTHRRHPCTLCRSPPAPCQGVRPPGEPGYVATLQVRLLHAQKRDIARRRGFDVAAFGAFHHQVGLALTWMDFTLTSMRAAEQMGFGLTTNESAMLYRYWWLLAHLLGIDPPVEGIASNDQGARVDELLQAVTGPPIPKSAQLAAATVASISSDLHEALSIPHRPRRQGAQHAGPPIPWRDAVRRPRPFVFGDGQRGAQQGDPGSRARRTKLRRDPAKWEAARQRHLDQARQQLATITDLPEYAGHQPSAGPGR